MKKRILKFQSLENYIYTIVFIIAIILFIWMYSFLRTNALKTLTSTDVQLDPASIRIVDVNLNKFKEVLENIDKKSSYTNVNPRNVFE